MTPSPFELIPFIPDVQNLPFDLLVSFVVSFLLAIMIHAEAQAWMATVLGDVRPGAKDRFHFNVFFHLSVPGTLCYFLAGFGWPKPIDIDPTKFAWPRLFLVLSRLSGAIANLLLANIAASIILLFRFFEMDPRVFLMVAGVNVTTAVYHLLPIPPLAAGSLITMWFPQASPTLRRILYYGGVALIFAIFLTERFAGFPLVSPYLNPLARRALYFLIS